jgi:integrase
MATIELRLSSKIQKDSGKAEILIRFYQGSTFNLRAKSEVFINPCYFEYFIDRDKTKDNDVNVPNNIISTTIDKAVKYGYVLRDCGNIVINKRISTPDVKYHREQMERLDAIKKNILDTFENSSISDVKGDWLKCVVDKYNHPDKYLSISMKEKKTFSELVEMYISKRQISYSHARVVRVLVRDVARYEGFIRLTDKENKDFIFDIDKVTRSTIDDFTDYLRNEKSLSEQYPRIFEKLLTQYPAGIKKGKDILVIRGENTIIKMTKQLKSIFNWLNESNITTNHPFEGIKFASLKFGTPYYISIDERNKIADFDFSDNKHLETQRDIFVFQCFVGCRVGDLMKLDYDNIVNDMLIYAPHKTKDKGEQSLVARVPLHPKAKALIEKYVGVDELGRLFPFITAQKYNDAIKDIFTKVGIVRPVVIRNAKTGENETIPINEIASSHLARRTFVGNAYFKVSDPNIIGKMSGHVEGSRAFARYRKIEDSTLQDVINQLG